MELVFNTRFFYTPPKGTITFYGKALIESFIAQQRLSLESWQVANPGCNLLYLPQLPETWQWIWLVTKGEFRGKFPTRVAQYYSKAHGLKCPDAFLSNMGNLAREHSQDGDTFEFDFDNEMDWYPGDFGDHSSCYWDENAGAIDMIRENGGGAVRFFKDGNGFARAWLASVAPGIVVWNGYGLETRQIAQILAGFWNMSYRKIGLTNHGATGGRLWINGGVGYVLGQAGLIDMFNRFDLGFDSITVCADCGDPMDGIYEGADGHEYCNNCFYERFDYCHHCNETYYRDSMEYIEAVEGDVCEFCINHLYTPCQECLQYSHKSDVQIYDGRQICPDCRESMDESSDDATDSSSS